MVSEIRQESDRLGVPFSALIQKAWEIAKSKLVKIPDPVEIANIAREKIEARRKKIPGR